jgi:hypothetical protein
MTYLSPWWALAGLGGSYDRKSNPERLRSGDAKRNPFRRICQGNKKAQGRPDSGNAAFAGPA